MDKRYQVFVSSTYDDLRNEREIVMRTLVKMGCIPAGMELFPAVDEEQFEFIKKVIDDCDYYLLIIGGRYGSATSSGLSYTEKEYNYAKKAGIKVIALIHDKPEDIPAGKSESAPKLRKKLEAFRNKVAKNRLVNFWTEANELSGFVALNVSNAIAMYPAIGWVRANQVSNTELLAEINELRKNKERLESEIQALKSSSDTSIFTPHEDSEFNYIFSRLKGFHKATCRFSFPKGQREEGENVILVNYSFLRVLRRSISKGKTSFNDNILIILEEDAKELKELISYIEKGYIFYYFRPEQKLKGDLTTLGLLDTNFIPATDNEHTAIYRSLMGGGDRTIFMFSEMMYKFVKWLDFNDKIKDEPETEFINFAVEDTLNE
jgi:hypothetical protein